MTASIGTEGIPGLLNAMDYARDGIGRGTAAYQRVAAQLAGAVAHPAALAARHEVAALSARNQVEASARVFEAGSQLLGTLLDRRA